MVRDEIDRRYGLIREAMAEEHLDAVLVCGSEYTGFEGAITYMSGFVIVHRYAYVILPREGEPTIVFPTSASTEPAGSRTRSSSTGRDSTSVIAGRVTASASTAWTT
jgi:Xaa-Pro dipeptidase